MFRMLSILEDSEIPKLLQKANTPLRNDSVTATSLRTRSREAYPNAGIPAAVLTGKTETPENEQFLAPGVFCCTKTFALRRRFFVFIESPLRAQSGSGTSGEYFFIIPQPISENKKAAPFGAAFLQSIIQLHEPELPRAGRRFFCGLHRY